MVSCSWWPVSKITSNVFFVLGVDGQPPGMGVRESVRMSQMVSGTIATAAAPT